MLIFSFFFCFFFQAEDGIRDGTVTGVQTCALPICGELTPHEAVRLEKQQQHIAREEKRDMAKHGGHLTKAEQAKLNREQNRASRNIAAKKYNARVR